MRTLLLLAVIVTLLATKQRADELPASVSSLNTAAAAGAFVPEIGLDVTANDIQVAYSANEVAADTRYRHQLLNVTGTVQAIRRGADNVPYLVLSAEGEPEGVRAAFDPAVGRALADVAKGDVVVVRCRGGGMTAGAPVMHSCTLSENRRAGSDARAWPSDGVQDNVRSWSWE